MLRDLTEQSTLLLLISEVIELEGNADILLAQETDHRLQIIPFFTRNTYFFDLDSGLYL